VTQPPEQDAAPEPLDAATTSVALDSTGHVARDLPCIVCSYNLRTLHLAGVCPECGTPVNRTVVWHDTEPRRWLKTVASGFTTCAFGVGGAVVVGFVIVVAARAGAPSLLPALLLLLLIAVFLAILVPLGLMEITAPSPLLRFRREGLTARRLVRWCLWLPLLLTPPLGLSACFGLPLGPVGMVAEVSAVAAGACLFALFPALAGHIEALMKTVGAPRVARLARVVLWITLAAETVGLWTASLPLHVRAWRNGPPVGWLALTAVLAVVAWLFWIALLATAAESLRAAGTAEPPPSEADANRSREA
jgi:hypothetical protein